MGYNNYNRGFEIDEEKAAEFLQNAVEKMLMAWRREARVLYDNQRSKRMAQSSN